MAMTNLPHTRTLRGPEILALLLLGQRAADAETNSNLSPYRTSEILEAAQPTPIGQALETLEELGLVEHPTRPNGKPYQDHWDITTAGESLLRKRAAKDFAEIVKHANAETTRVGLAVQDADREARRACAARCRELMDELGISVRARAPAPGEKPKTRTVDAKAEPRSNGPTGQRRERQQPRTTDNE